jgi:hypothetical protein
VFVSHKDDVGRSARQSRSGLHLEWIAAKLAERIGIQEVLHQRAYEGYELIVISADRAHRHYPSIHPLRMQIIR